MKELPQQVTPPDRGGPRHESVKGGIQQGLENLVLNAQSKVVAEQPSTPPEAGSESGWQCTGSCPVPCALAPSAVPPTSPASAAFTSLQHTRHPQILSMLRPTCCLATCRTS